MHLMPPASKVSISDTEAQIADPRRDVSVPDFAIEGHLPLSCKPGVGFSPVSARVHCGGLPVRCRYFEENTSTRAVFCSPRRLRPLGTHNPCHSLAAMLACCLNDCYQFSVSVVARANAGIGERAGGSRGSACPGLAGLPSHCVDH